MHCEASWTEAETFRAQQQSTLNRFSSFSEARRYTLSQSLSVGILSIPWAVQFPPFPS